MSNNYKIQKQISYLLNFAIEKYIKELEKKDKHYFNYHNLNLKNPVRNYLYIKCRSEPFFIDIFESIARKTKKIIYLEDEHFFNILKIINNKIGNSKIKIKKIKKNYDFYKKVQKFLSSILNFFLRLCLDIISFLLNILFKKKNVTCLFYCNEKLKTRLNEVIFKNSNLSYKYISNNITDMFRNNLPAMKTLFLKKNYNFKSINEIENKFHDICLLSKNLKNSYECYSPKSVLSYEGDTVFESVSNEVCKLLNINNFCIQWGSQMYEPIKISNTGMEFKRFYVWDNFHKNYYKNYNKKTNFKVAGYPFFKKKKSFVKRKKIIFGLRPSSHAFSKEDQKRYFNLIKNIIISFPEWEVIVRLHPRMKNNFKPLEKSLAGLNYQMQNASVSLVKALSDASIVCSIHSSLLIDSLFFDCIPININTGNLALVKNANFKKLKTGIIIKKYDDSFKEIAKLMKSTQLIKLYRKNIHKQFNKLKTLDKFKKIVLKDLTGKSK